jgi:iron(III) transport system substrate-binding protein
MGATSMELRDALRRSSTIVSFLLAVVVAACSSQAPAVPSSTAAGVLAPTATKATVTSATSSSAPTTAAEIFLYNGPDRQKILEDGAKKEPRLTWYTSLIISDRARPLADAFTRKYPYITVDATFLDSDKLVSRAIEESNAKKYTLDFVEASYPAITALKSAKVIAKFASPSIDGFPKEAIDPDGFFVADRENPLGFTWNTNEIPESQGPKSFDDLLDPKWKGKIATNNQSQAIQYFGAVGLIKGASFLPAFAKQDIRVQSIASNAVIQLVASGEIVATLPASVGQVAVAKKKGAPLSWTGLDKAPTALGYEAVAANAPHPYATMLFVDFLLSKEGQDAMASTGEGGVRTGTVNSYGGYDLTKFFTDAAVPQDQYIAEYAKWTANFNTTFLQGSGR